jgi:hypothetical protein
MDDSQRRWLQAQIRRQYARMPGPKPSDEAWAKARVSYGKYQCAECKGIFGPKEVHKDHIDPVIDPATGFIDWNTWMERLDGPIQILCIPDHKAKSKRENAKRTRKPRSKA